MQMFSFTRQKQRADIVRVKHLSRIRPGLNEGSFSKEYSWGNGIATWLWVYVLPVVAIKPQLHGHAPLWWLYLWGRCSKHICVSLSKRIQLQAQAVCALEWSITLSLMCFIGLNINVKIIPLISVIFQKWLEESYAFTPVRTTKGKEEPKRRSLSF